LLVSELLRTPPLHPLLFAPSRSQIVFPPFPDAFFSLSPESAACVPPLKFSPSAAQDSFPLKILPFSFRRAILSTAAHVARLPLMDQDFPGAQRSFAPPFQKPHFSPPSDPSQLGSDCAEILDLGVDLPFPRRVRARNSENFFSDPQRLPSSLARRSFFTACG